MKRKKEDEESEEEDDSLSDQLQSDDSESSESESSPEVLKKGKKKKEEITEADRRNSKVCAFDPCERQENCGFVHVKSGSVPKDYKNERNPNYTYHRGDPESETSETAEEGKEYDGERRPLRRPEDHCQGSSKEGGKGSHKGDKEKEKEVEEEKEKVEEILCPEKLCDVLYNKNSFQPNDSPTYSSFPI